MTHNEPLHYNSAVCMHVLHGAYMFGMFGGVYTIEAYS